MFAVFVYLLCGVTSLFCSWLLVGAYKKTRNRFVLWTSICFMCLTINSFFVVMDFIVFPTVEMSMIRLIALLLGPVLLIYGLLKESL